MNLKSYITDRLLFCPDKNIKLTPSDYNLQYEDIYIKSSNNNNLHGWFIPNESNNFIIYLHGSKGSIGLYLKGISKLYQTGANILIVDYSGFGKSTGIASVENSILDGIAMLNYLTEKRHAKKVSLFGYSYGGAIAAEIAKNRPIHGIVVESTFSSLLEVAKEKYPILANFLVSTDSLNTKKTLSTLTMPKLIAYAENDQVIPIKHSLEIYNEACEKKHLFKIRNAKHHDICDFVTDEYINLIKDFLIGE